jgi:hypothetical protein
MARLLLRAALYGALFLLASAPLPGLAALPPAPTPVMLTSNEASTLAQGEVVLRSAARNPEGLTLGVVDVPAAPAAVIDAVVDLMARVAEVSLIDRARYYLEERDPAGTGRLGIQWFVGGLGLTKSFHVLYEYDRNQGLCAFALDGSKPNEIAATAGSYYAYPASGGSRLEYRAQASTDGPTWLRGQLEGASLREQLLGIRARAAPQ